MKDMKGNVDFLVDLPMVFSVVRPEELVAVANEFYGTNIILPKAGSKFDVKVRANGKVEKYFYLYKITLKRLDKDEKEFKKDIGEFETTMDKCGVFSSLYEVMDIADSITVFSQLEEVDIFLRAMLRSDSNLTSKSAFLCTDKEIEGLN